MKSIQDSLVAEIELSYRPAIADKPVIKSCLDASLVIRSFIPENTIALKEHFVVLYLNQAQRVIAGYKLSEGGLTSTVGDLRLIFSVALKSVATSFIVGHNHPSGNLVPSSQDQALTVKLAEAGRLMDIRLMDHIIVSPNPGEYYSFADNGLL